MQKPKSGGGGDQSGVRHSAKSCPLCRSGGPCSKGAMHKSVTSPPGKSRILFIIPMRVNPVKLDFAKFPILTCFQEEEQLVQHNFYGLFSRRKFNFNFLEMNKYCCPQAPTMYFHFYRHRHRPAKNRSWQYCKYPKYDLFK